MPLILAFMPQAFADTTFSCTAVRDKANVGVHDNVSVNITTSTVGSSVFSCRTHSTPSIFGNCTSPV